MNCNLSLPFYYHNFTSHMSKRLKTVFPVRFYFKTDWYLMQHYCILHHCHTLQIKDLCSCSTKRSHGFEVVEIKIKSSLHWFNCNKKIMQYNERQNELFTVSDCPLRSSSSCWYFMAGIFPLAWISFFRAWATSSLRLRAVALIPAIRKYTMKNIATICSLHGAFAYIASKTALKANILKKHPKQLNIHAALSNIPVVRIEMSTNPVLGSVADCLRASRCSRLASSTSIVSTFSEKRTLAWASARRIRDSSCLG